MLKNNLYNSQGLKALLDSLVKQKYIESEKVYNAMLNVDRADFTDSDPYTDCPQGINYGATISAPHMHAFALEYLKDHLSPGKKALDVGYGSGYLCSAFSKLMEDKGLVIGIEHIPELCELGKTNILKNSSKLLENKTIILQEGDGRKGCEEHAPYDCIHVGASADFIHEDLVKQLNLGGRMMIPVGKQNENQYVNIVDKDMDGNVTVQKVLGVRYVPLTSKDKQLKKYF